MNAVTESITPETTEFQRSVLRAMLELAGSNTSNEIAKQAGVKSEPVRVSLARMRDNGLIDTEANPDKGGPPLWYLRVSAATVRQMLAANPATVANDGEPGDGSLGEDRDETQAQAEPEHPGVDDTEEALARRQIALARELMACGCRPGEGFDDPDDFGDDEPAPEPGDTQAVDAVEAAPVPGHCASLDDPDNFGDDEMPAAAPDPDGWIPWNGGDCPVPVGSRCSIRIRCADAAKCVRNPEAWWWGRREDCQAGDGDIIAYRPEPKQTGPASFDDPDDYGDDEIPPAAAYDATVEAEAKADEAPLIGEDVNSDADVLGGWCADHEMAISPRPVRGDDVAMLVSADGSVSADMPALRFAPPATGGAVASGPCPTVALLIQRASQVTEEAAQRAIDTAEVEALMREEEADIALEMARDARVRGRAVAEIIRFAEQRAGLAGDADPGAVLAAIVELLDGARSAVTGMSLPA